MDIQKGDILEMKKLHPCGNKTFLVLRTGMDFKLKCLGCNHEFMISRKKAQRNIKKIINESFNANNNK